MLIIGLTGGIGSGKSSVSREFEALGIHITDTDVIAREVVAAGSTSLTKIASHFGTDILLENGLLDRKKLRGIIFNAPEEKQWLESVLHPVIRQETRNSLHRCTSPYAILSSPLLLESPDVELVNRVAVVDIPTELQEKRTAVRDTTNASEVQKIIAVQMPREKRLALANDIIDNSDNFEHTCEQVLALHNIYIELSKSTAS